MVNSGVYSAAVCEVSASSITRQSSWYQSRRFCVERRVYFKDAVGARRTRKAARGTHPDFLRCSLMNSAFMAFLISQVLPSGATDWNDFISRISYQRSLTRWAGVLNNETPESPSGVFSIPRWCLYRIIWNCGQSATQKLRIKSSHIF